MVIPVDEPVFVFGDNQSVMCNTSNPATTLKKKSNIITFHRVLYVFDLDEWRTEYMNTHKTLADIFTKQLYGEKQGKFVNMLLHHL